MSKSKARTEAALAVKGEKADPSARAGAQRPHLAHEGVRTHFKEGQGPSGSFKALRLRILFLSLNWNIIPSLGSLSPPSPPPPAKSRGGSERDKGAVVEESFSQHHPLSGLPKSSLSHRSGEKKASQDKQRHPFPSPALSPHSPFSAKRAWGFTVLTYCFLHCHVS